MINRDELGSCIFPDYFDKMKIIRDKLKSSQEHHNGRLSRKTIIDCSIILEGVIPANWNLYHNFSFVNRLLIALMKLSENAYEILFLRTEPKHECDFYAIFDLYNLERLGEKQEDPYSSPFLGG